MTPSDPIHLFVPTFRVDEVLAGIRECLEKGWTGLGFKTVEIEQRWSEHTGLPHSHFLSSASAGLHLAVRLLKERGGWSDGDEIVTAPLTFVSTNHAILYERLTPVFADVDEYLCLDPASVEARISPRTRAVMFVGLGGNPGRLADVLAICRRRGLALILDAAHMAGTWTGREHAGAGTDAAVFSFQAVKNLPTADSGMICFADPQLDAEARKWSWMGINKDTYTRTLSAGTYKWMYDVEHVGFKYHGNSIMAAMALVGLKYMEEDNALRRRLCAVYDEALAGATGAADADSSADGIRRVPMAPGCTPSRHLYQILVRDRDDVMVRLNERGVYPGVHYRDNTLYRMYSGSQPCPNARRASEQLISLPLHLRMTDDDARRVVDALEESVRAGGQERSGR